MVRHSSDESEAPEMVGEYSKAIEKRRVLRWREKKMKWFDSAVAGPVNNTAVTYIDKLDPYGTDGRLLLTANFTVT